MVKQPMKKAPLCPKNVSGIGWGGVGHVGVGWVGHAGVGWVIQGWGGVGLETLYDPPTPITPVV